MTNKPTKEQENMPEISAAAERTLSKFPEYNKQNSFLHKKKKAILETCKICNESYNKTAKWNILATLPTIANFDYTNTCLNCIKEVSNKIKAIKYPKIKEIKEKLDEVQILYYKAHNQFRKETKEYQALDYQENMITHCQKQATIKKSSTKKPSTNTKTNKALAMKALANLTSEQQKAVLANINKIL